MGLKQAGRKTQKEGRIGMNLSDTRSYEDERRGDLRRKNTVTIFFEYKNLLHRAKLKNRSQSGFFINTGNPLLIGDTINVAIPQTDNTHAIFKGKIIWTNQEGCGVELLEELK